MEAQLLHIWNHKYSFLAAFFIVFTFIYGTLFALDWLPEPVSQVPEIAQFDSDEELPPAPEDALNITIVEEISVEALDEPAAAPVDRPVSIRFDTLNKTVSVANPESRSIAALDAALLNGVVRHPDSATLDQEGNVFILGHSSYLPNVLNKNFQAFNGIQKLEWGDTITVTGEYNIYVYQVDDVYEAKASELFVPIADTGHRLTLATCDSFGSVDDRFIVEADLLSVTPIEVAK